MASKVLDDQPQAFPQLIIDKTRTETNHNVRVKVHTPRLIKVSATAPEDHGHNPPKILKH